MSHLLPNGSLFTHVYFRFSLNVFPKAPYFFTSCWKELGLVKGSVRLPSVTALISQFTLPHCLTPFVCVCSSFHPYFHFLHAARWDPIPPIHDISPKSSGAPDRSSWLGLYAFCLPNISNSIHLLLFPFFSFSHATQIHFVIESLFFPVRISSYPQRERTCYFSPHLARAFFSLFLFCFLTSPGISLCHHVTIERLWFSLCHTPLIYLFLGFHSAIHPIHSHSFSHFPNHNAYQHHLFSGGGGALYSLSPHLSFTLSISPQKKNRLP